MPKIAVVGLGNWGKNLIAEFSKLSDVVFAVGIRNKENENWLSQNFPSTSYTTDLDMVLSGILDAIVVVTPPETHLEIAKRVLESKKHLLIEKPPAFNTKDADELLKLAQKYKKSLFVDHTFYYHRAFQEFLKLANKENFNTANFKWLKWGTFKDDIFWNLAYHDIYLAIALFGEAESLSIILNESDKIHFKIHFKNGKDAEVFIDRRSKQKSKSIIIDNVTWSDGILYKNAKPIFKSQVSSLEDTCKAFINQLDNPVYENFQLARQTISLLENLKK